MKKEQDYRAFFVIGASLVAAGIASEIYGLVAVGVAFMVIGLTNKNKTR